MRTIAALLLGLLLALVPAQAGQAAEDRGHDVIYRHVLLGADVPFYVRCSTTEEWRAIWRGQWSTDKCGADYGMNLLELRVPLGYALKLRAWACQECRPRTLWPGVYTPPRPDRALWLVPLASLDSQA